MMLLFSSKSRIHHEMTFVNYFNELLNIIFSLFSKEKGKAITDDNFEGTELGKCVFKESLHGSGDESC